MSIRYVHINGPWHYKTAFCCSRRLVGKLANSRGDWTPTAWNTLPQVPSTIFQTSSLSPSNQPIQFPDQFPLTLAAFFTSLPDDQSKPSGSALRSIEPGFILCKKGRKAVERRGKSTFPNGWLIILAAQSHNLTDVLVALIAISLYHLVCSFSTSSIHHFHPATRFPARSIEQDR